VAAATDAVISARLVLDGGGTSTDVGLFDGESVIRRTQLPSYKPALSSANTDLLCRDLGSWMASASLLPPHYTPTFVLVGMAGVWTAHEKQSYLNALTDSWITYVSADVPRMVVLSDVELAHLAAFGSQSGTVLIAGTGSIAVHRSSDGQWQRVGGWGPRIDDAGGGFWMGREALTAVARMVDGRGPDTLLIRPVAAYLRTNAEDIDHVALRLRRASVDGAARLARAVLTYADEGDAVAQEIRSSAVRELVKLVSGLPASSRVALYGSLFGNAPFASAVKAEIPQVSVTILEDVLQGAIAALPTP
jgi:N-acetylglucosamine kinase-like BadF-type ATPase